MTKLYKCINDKLFNYGQIVTLTDEPYYCKESEVATVENVTAEDLIEFIMSEFENANMHSMMIVLSTVLYKFANTFDEIEVRKTLFRLIEEHGTLLGY